MMTAKTNQPKRFEIGLHVRLGNGIEGTVVACNDERGPMGQYWHVVETKHGERKEPGCNLELIDPPIAPRKPGGGKVADTIHFHGDNSRLNFNSIDRSTNTVAGGPIFNDMREKAADVADVATRTQIIERIDALEAAQGTSGFLSAYQAFIATAADHLTLFSILMPSLTMLLSHH